jgi:uncharacterized protein GlcG (DUF336 family)
MNAPLRTTLTVTVLTIGLAALGWLSHDPAARAQGIRISIGGDDAPTEGAEGAEAAEAAAAEPLQTLDISADQAHVAVAAAMKKAEKMDLKMNIAVVDAGGNLKAFLRMDGAWLGSIDIAIKKARTARYFDMPTGDIGQLSQPGKSLYNIEHSNGGLITFPGGVPIHAGDGTVIGAIGVSGSSVENDHTVATAGAGVLN